MEKKERLPNSVAKRLAKEHSGFANPISAAGYTFDKYISSTNKNLFKRSFKAAFFIFLATSTRTRLIGANFSTALFGFFNPFSS